MARVSLLFVLLVVAVSSLAATGVLGTNKPTEFNFVDTLAGDWYIEKTTTRDAPFIEGTTLLGVANFTKADDQLNGVLKFSGQDRISSIVVKATGTMEGTMTIGSPDLAEDVGESSTDEVTVTDEDELPTVTLPYHFKMQINTGHPISADRFKSSLPKVEGHYTLVVSTPVTFILTLTSPVANKEGQTEYAVVTYVGKKIQEVQPLSFFQQYGSMIMVLVFVVGSRFLTQRFARPRPEVPEQGAQPQPAAPQQQPQQPKAQKED